MKKGIIWGAGIVIGATAGYLYWYFVGCASGSCIQKLYPDDRAINYSQGDLRGAWHIIFKSQRK